MQIVFDLDNVIRDLDKAIETRFECKVDDYYFTHKGKDIYDLAKEDNYNFIRNAPVTKYYKIIKRYFPYPTIWSHQPLDWQEHTLHWLNTHFFAYNVFFYTPQEKALALKNDNRIILVEDYQGFSNYSRIVLIDKVYNQYVNAPIRVKTIKELEICLRRTVWNCKEH